MEFALALFGSRHDDVAEGEVYSRSGPTTGYVNLGTLVHFHFRAVIEAEDGGGVLGGADRVILVEFGSLRDENEGTAGDAVERAIDLLDGGAGPSAERGEFVVAPVAGGSGDEDHRRGNGPNLVVDARTDGRGHDDDSVGTLPEAVQRAAALDAFADVDVKQKLARGIERSGQGGGHEVDKTGAIADGGGTCCDSLSGREEALADAGGGLFGLGDGWSLRANLP